MKTRTTITLERDLLRRAKMHAAATDRSLSDLLEEALRAALGEPSTPRRRFKFKVFEGGQGLAPATRPEEVLKPWHLIDRLDREASERGDQPS